ncbi:MAG: hypothetical protein H0V56_06735, partial [Chthoniobacterales bacterium]|nr:hypothetical protein [Chthoniobacterales bacterium]
YASLARLGVYRPWRVLTSSAAVEPRRYARPELVWQIADILSDNSARTLAFGINSALRYDYPVAAKTGTSTDFRDNWTIGFTPEFSVGVWVGNFDGSPMQEVSGVTGAGPILREIFDHLHVQKGTSWYATPPGIVERKVHPLTGKLLTDDDGRGVVEKFVPGNLPPPAAPADYDAEGRVQLGSEYAEWLASAENSLHGQAILARGGLRIASPLEGTTFLLDPDVPSSSRIPLLGSGGAKLVWRSDSLALAADGEARYAVGADGEHRITLFDPESGQSAEVRISIRSL